MVGLCMLCYFLEPQVIQLLCLIGTGAIGDVHIAVWCGTIVALNIVHIAGNKKVVENGCMFIGKLMHHAFY